MRNQLIASHIDALHKRALVKGGFVARIGGVFLVDANAWAVLALIPAGAKPDFFGHIKGWPCNANEQPGVREVILFGEPLDSESS